MFTDDRGIVLVRKTIKYLLISRQSVLDYRTQTNDIECAEKSGMNFLFLTSCE